MAKSAMVKKEYKEPSEDDMMRMEAEHQVGEMMRDTPHFKKAVETMMTEMKGMRKRVMKQMGGKMAHSSNDVTAPPKNVTAPPRVAL